MKKRILIVDDDGTNRYMLETLLKGYGFEVTSAENGEDALDKATLNPPDLIVSDILMPVMDGYNLCRQWKSHDAFKHIPFVFYTATYTGSKNEDFALGLGAERFIVKPQEPDILVNILKEVLEENYIVKQVATKPLEEEIEFFRQYNEILFQKLENKMKDLDDSNRRLKMSEEFYRLSFSNVSDVIYTIDKDLNILTISPSVERILGYKPQDFIGQSASELGNILMPESFEQAIADIGLILQGETIPATVYRFIAKDGTIKFGEVSGSPLMREGEIAGIVSVARDITKRKQAEEILQALSSRHEAILAADPEIIVEVDSNKVYTWANSVGKEFFGEDLLGKEAAFYFEGEQETYDAVKPLFYGSKDIVYVESWQRRKDGAKRLLAWRCQTLKDESGQVTGALSSARDITEQKHQEKELRRVTVFLDSIIENIPDMVFVKDAGELRFVRFNRAGEALLGHSRDELLGKNDYDFFPKEQADFFTQKDRDVLHRKEITDIPEEPIQTPNKGVCILHTKKVPILDTNGEPEYLLGISEDITERKRAEEALRERDIQFRKLSSTVPGMIYQFKKRPDGTYCVPFSTEAIRDIFGCSPEDVREDFSSINRVILPEDLNKLIDSIEASAEHMTTWQCEYRVQIPGRPVRWLFGLSTPEKLTDGSIIWHGFNADITERKRIEEQLQQTLESLRKAVGTTIQVMVSAVEARDPYTSGHQIRSANLGRAIAIEMGLPQDKIEGIGMAGSIHDIGKLSIPAEILSKPTRLTNIEFSLIKEHAQAGYEMLKEVESPWPLAQIVYQHHERMDGSGYPRQLKGDEILMEARILAVADVVEAMASYRPYRPGLGIDAALNEIERTKGTLYDAEAVDACLRLFREKGFILKET